MNHSDSISDARKQFLIDRINTCPFNEAHQITAQRVEKGCAEIHAVLTQECLNIWAMPHGGILFAIADVAAGLSAQSTHEGKVVTVSATTNFLKSSQGHLIRAFGREIRSGRTISFVSVDVKDDSDELLLTGQFVMHCSDMNPAEKSKNK